MHPILQFMKTWTYALPMLALACCSAPPPQPELPWEQSPVQIEVVIDELFTEVEAVQIMSAARLWSAASCGGILFNFSRSIGLPPKIEDMPPNTFWVRHGAPPPESDGETIWRQAPAAPAATTITLRPDAQVILHEFGHALDLSYDGHVHQEAADPLSVVWAGGARDNVAMPMPVDVAALCRRWTCRCRD